MNQTVANIADLYALHGTKSFKVPRRTKTIWGFTFRWSHVWVHIGDHPAYWVVWALSHRDKHNAFWGTGYAVDIRKSDGSLDADDYSTGAYFTIVGLHRIPPDEMKRAEWAHRYISGLVETAAAKIRAETTPPEPKPQEPL